MSEQKLSTTKLFYSDVEIGEMLGVSRQMVRKLVRNGDLAEPYKFSRKVTRWHVDDINQYIDTVHKRSRLEGGAA